jgi:hypothetical protein
VLCFGRFKLIKSKLKNTKLSSFFKCIRTSMTLKFHKEGTSFAKGTYYSRNTAGVRKERKLG